MVISQQDISKKIFDTELFINFDEIIEKLVISKLQCYYCKHNMSDFICRYVEIHINGLWIVLIIIKDIITIML